MTLPTGYRLTSNRTDNISSLQSELGKYLVIHTIDYTFRGQLHHVLPGYVKLSIGDNVYSVDIKEIIQIKQY